MEEGITAELLATGPVPAYPPLPAEIALYRLRIAPGGRIVTPGDDLALGLVAVESGTVVIRRTVAGVVTRGAVLATPGAQADEAVPDTPPFPGRPIRSEDVDGEPVMVGEGGRLRMQRYWDTWCDMTPDHSLGAVVDDRRAPRRSGRTPAGGSPRR